MIRIVLSGNSLIVVDMTREEFRQLWADALHAGKLMLLRQAEPSDQEFDLNPYRVQHVEDVVELGEDGQPHDR